MTRFSWRRNRKRRTQAEPTAGGAQPDSAEAGLPQTREAIAEYLIRRRHTIRAMAQRRLDGRRTAAGDEDDVFSSVVRIIDEMYVSGSLRTESPAEFWALVCILTRNVTLKKISMERLTYDWHDEVPIDELVRRVEACTDDGDAALLVHRMLMSLPDDGSRDLFLLRLRGASCRDIAESIDVNEAAVRQRWSRLCRRLRRDFGTAEQA